MVLVTFLNAVTEYPNRNNLREEWFILACILRVIVQLGGSRRRGEGCKSRGGRSRDGRSRSGHMSGWVGVRSGGHWLHCVFLFAFFVLLIQ